MSIITTKIKFLAIFLLLTSCVQSYGGVGCMRVSATKQQRAQAMYNTFGTVLEHKTLAEGREIFGCHFWDTDYIYSYSTLWGKKYILVRHGEVITYADAKESEAKKEQKKTVEDLGPTLRPVNPPGTQQ